METAIPFIIVIVILIMFFSVKVSKLLSVIVFVVVFIGANAVLINQFGVTDHTYKNMGILAFIFFIAWLRINKSFAETARSQAWLQARENQIKTPPVCERCRTEVPHNREPRNFSQFMWGGWTCPNCGAELDRYGKEKSNWTISR